MADHGPSACPPLADLAMFCWGQGLTIDRAAILEHLSLCRSCRARAARIVASSRSDRQEHDDVSRE